MGLRGLNEACNVKRETGNVKRETGSVGPASLRYDATEGLFFDMGQEGAVECGVGSAGGWAFAGKFKHLFDTN